MYHNSKRFPAFVLKSAVLSSLKPTAKIRQFIAVNFNKWLPCVVVDWPTDTLTTARTKIRAYADTKDWQFTVDMKVPTISIMLNGKYTNKLGTIPLSCWSEYNKLKTLIIDIQSLQEKL